MSAFLLRILGEAALVQELETEIKATIVIQQSPVM
jgi:hypothetical protein